MAKERQPTETARRLRGAGLFFLLYLFCWGWALDGAHLSGTEGFRAITAHQMVERGFDAVPRLYGVIYLRKPPLHYWILAGAEWLIGRADEWVWRLPSVVGAAWLGAGLCLLSSRWWGLRAGRITGFAYLALAALWSQFRSADIDALNTLAAVTAALCFIEIYTAPRPRSWRWAAAAGLAMGAALLLKGPAGMPLILGAIIGPVIANRRWSMAWRQEIWVALLSGTFIFGAAAVGMYLHIESLGASIDTSGLKETADRMLLSGWRQFLEAAILPVRLFLYALPVSATVLFAMRPGFLRALDPAHAFRLRSLLGTLAASLLIGMVTGMTNPRYAYINLPLLALIAGSLAYAWRIGALSPGDQRTLLRLLLLFSGVLLIGLSAAMGWLFPWHRAPWAGAAITALIAGAAWALVDAIRHARHPRFLRLIAALLVLSSLVFAHIKNDRREKRSAYDAAQILRERAGDGPVITGLMLWTHPELFYYADVEVRPYNRYRFETPFELEEDRGWVVFHRWEWSVWSKAYPDRFRRAISLPTRVPGTVLVWYQNNAQRPTSR